MKKYTLFSLLIGLFCCTNLSAQHSTFEELINQRLGIYTNTGKDLTLVSVRPRGKKLYHQFEFHKDGTLTAYYDRTIGKWSRKEQYKGTWSVTKNGNSINTFTFKTPYEGGTYKFKKIRRQNLYLSLLNGKVHPETAPKEVYQYVVNSSKNHLQPIGFKADSKANPITFVYTQENPFYKDKIKMIIKYDANKDDWYCIPSKVTAAANGIDSTYTNYEKAIPKSGWKIFWEKLIDNDLLTIPSYQKGDYEIYNVTEKKHEFFLRVQDSYRVFEHYNVKDKSREVVNVKKTRLLHEIFEDEFGSALRKKMPGIKFDKKHIKTFHFTPVVSPIFKDEKSTAVHNQPSLQAFIESIVSKSKTLEPEVISYAKRRRQVKWFGGTPYRRLKLKAYNLVFIKHFEPSSKSRFKAVSEHFDPAKNEIEIRIQSYTKPNDPKDEGLHGMLGFYIKKSIRTVKVVNIRAGKKVVIETINMHQAKSTQTPVRPKPKNPRTPVRPRPKNPKSNPPVKKVPIAPMTIMPNLQIADIFKDPFRVEQTQIKGNILEVKINYEGGCGDPKFRLIWDKKSPVKKRPKVLLTLDMYNDDNCSSIVKKTLWFDISKLKEIKPSNGLEVLINGRPAATYK